MKKLILVTLLVSLATSIFAQGYLEVPAIKPQSDCAHVTTYMEHGGTSIRSFTYKYDTSKRIALWVAYPLNAGLIGTGSRGDGWLPDPHLKESEQAILYKGFRYGSGFDRGHQIPSADRLNPAANEQTFRFTNATPQLHDFNGGIWAELEKLVRTWAKRSDTLFVVTGCVPGDKTIPDNIGSPVNIPSAYYKVLLRQNTSKSGLVQWSACAVLLPHEVFPVKTWQENVALFRQHSLTVSELEHITGEIYFPMLEKKIPQQKFNEIKLSPADAWWWR